MVTPGCCCWYLANATLKNGASNVEPDPVSVGEWPPGPVLAAATADAGAPVVPGVLVLVQAATARTMRAAAAARAGPAGRRGREPGSAGWPDMAAPLR
jgi:hypothetical protein